MKLLSTRLGNACFSHMQPFQEAPAPGMKQTGLSTRADTNHFYNCLQQKRKHELNSSVVDGFEGEAANELSAGWSPLLSWDLLPGP